MDMTLAEVAQLLGRTERQVRYAIRRGTLTGRKVAGRWRVDSETLPLTDAQRAEVRRRAAQARAAFDAALAPVEKAAGSTSGYSVTGLDAFSIGVELLGELTRAQACSTVRAQLRTGLEDLARGCHEFHPQRKAERFAAARDAVARAVVGLFVEPCPSIDAAALATRIEAEMIPKIGGLVAAQEKRNAKSRFARSDRGGSFLRGGIR
ncbi:MAG: helix-turn-helix domain-containing protein [Planctomycetota bacterium]